VFGVVISSLVFGVVMIVGMPILAAILVWQNAQRKK
jgi:hypothetical protein